MDLIVQQVLEGQFGFKLVRRIGRGGFAEVWEASQGSMVSRGDLYALGSVM